MTPELEAKLTRLKNYRTRYEITATKDGRTVLVGYTSRKGRRGLWNMLVQNDKKWVAFAGGDNIKFRARASEGADAEGWHVRFSGRTQRDAFISGEHPFFPQLVK